MSGHMDRDRYGSIDMDHVRVREISEIADEIAPSPTFRDFRGSIEIGAARLISSRHRVAHVLGSTRLVAWRWLQAARNYEGCACAEVDALEWRRLGA